MTLIPQCVKKSAHTYINTGYLKSSVQTWEASSAEAFFLSYSPKRTVKALNCLVHLQEAFA
jgi:hypothetical protein